MPFQQRLHDGVSHLVGILQGRVAPAVQGVHIYAWEPQQEQHDLCLAAGDCHMQCCAQVMPRQIGIYSILQEHLHGSAGSVKCRSNPDQSLFNVGHLQ